MEYYRINGVAQRRLEAYATVATGLQQVQAYVCAGVNVNFFMRCTVDATWAPGMTSVSS